MWIYLMVCLWWSFFRCGSKTVEPSGVVRRSWRWAQSSCRTPRPPLCSPSAAPPPGPWAPGCSWTPGSPPRSAPLPPCSPCQASWAAPRASQALTLLLLLLPCLHPCRPPSSTPRLWDTGLIWPTSALCAPHPRRTSAQLTRGTRVLPLWGWRPRSTFSLWGRRGDAERSFKTDRNLWAEPESFCWGWDCKIWELFYSSSSWFKRSSSMILSDKLWNIKRDTCK